MFGVSRRKVASFEKRVHKLGTAQGKIDLLWKGTLLIEQKSLGRDLGKAYKQAVDYFPGLKPEELPRYVLVCDFAHFELHDLEPDEGAKAVHKFKLSELASNIHRFAFIAGYRTQHIRESDPINQEAVVAVGQLHDALKRDNHTGEKLEVFLVRLLFCLFADDTGIFQPKDSFHDLIEFHTKGDGSDVGAALDEMFSTLNEKPEQRQGRLAEHFSQFPYVNGKLFEAHFRPPQFDTAMRKQLLALCSMNWGAISPAIFGAMFQTVIELDAADRRRELGAHYTSEANILKLLGPLCLDELHAEFEKIKGNKDKLFEFHKKLQTLTFLDPACGCGNFLVIAYRELRKLELEVLRAASKFGQRIGSVFGFLQVDVDQFYGIEIEEFPAQIAQVAMWLTDHQMNVLAGVEFGEVITRIPLVKSANIRKGNALEIDWAEFVPPRRLNYIMGNPPFIGKWNQSAEQKASLNSVTHGIAGAGVLDFVAGWFVKAGQYISTTPAGFGSIAAKANKGRKNFKDVKFGQGLGDLFADADATEIKQRRAIRCGFVSTNSITQGEQVGVLWAWMMAQGRHIRFAHRTFQWSNDAPGKAAVHCVIVGFGMEEVKAPRLFEYDDIKGAAHEIAAKNINPYLVDAPSVALPNRREPICKVSPIVFGSMPNDGGGLLLKPEEKAELLASEPNAAQWIRRFMGAEEFINNGTRWCLWLKDCPPQTLSKLRMVQKRVDMVRLHRAKSTRQTTKDLAATPALFGEDRQPSGKYVLVPRHSSETRAFVPMGFLKADIIAGDSNLCVPNATTYEFGILSSTMHNAWVRYTCGRLKSDFRYSAGIVYNNYPWPQDLSDKQREAVTYASFRKLRAACLWKAREDLRECLARADRARKKGGTGDIEALCIYDEALPVIEERISMLRSLRFDATKAARRDKTHMQRHKLGRMPVDWIARVHGGTKDGKYGDAVAVGILIPVRPEEVANRIRMKLNATGALVFEVEGSKLRDKGAGIAAHVDGIGQPVRWLTLSAVDPARQETLDWLRDRVLTNGGSLTVGKGLSASGLCSAFRAMSRRLFARHKSPPSFYALRHAACAELKASGVSVQEVAQGMGHSSALSQKAYGMRSQASGGYCVKASASRPVRVKNSVAGPGYAPQKITKLKYK